MGQISLGGIQAAPAGPSGRPHIYCGRGCRPGGRIGRDVSTEGIVGRRGDMGAGGCVGILEGVSPQCDRVTLWTFGGTEITFWGGASIAG